MPISRSNRTYYTKEEYEAAKRNEQISLNPSMKPLQLTYFPRAALTAVSTAPSGRYTTPSCPSG